MNDMARGMWDKIDEARAAKGLTWKGLATMIGESESRVSKWRSGTGEPDRHQLLRIARSLELGLKYLADDSIEGMQEELTEVERAILLAVRALGDPDEAFRRIVRPAVQPWTPGSVRDLTASEAKRYQEQTKGRPAAESPRQPPEKPGPIPPEEWLDGPRVPGRPDLTPPKTPRRKRGG